MKKRAVILIFLILIVLLSALVYGEVGGGIGIQSLSSVKWDYSGGSTSKSIWELSDNQLTIYFGHNTTLLDYTIYSGGVNITNIINVIGCNSSNNFISCTSSNSLLEFDVTALSIPSDETYIWNITTHDSEDGEENWTLTLTVLNDSLAPRYTLLNPLNYTIHKNESIEFKINITEEESGFKSAEIQYDWNSNVATTTTKAKKDLTSEGNNYTTNINLGEGNPGDNYFWFFFNITDKAGNANTQKDYYIYVDNQKPVVVLNNPTNDTIISTSISNFYYNMSDNSFGIASGFNPLVNCSLYLEGFYMGSNINNSNVTNEVINADLSLINDGVYNWYINCSDSAGWLTQSEVRIVKIDKNGPIILMTSHNPGDVINNNTNITFSVTDTPANVDSVWWISGANNNTFPGSGSGTYVLNSGSLLADLNNLEIYANDTVNNINNTNFTLYVDVNGPNIVLNSPPDNTFGSGNFTANVTDDYSANSSCILYVGNATNTQTVVNGTTGTFNANPGEGNHTWNITCTDLVGNSNTSVNRNVIIDTTNPAVTLVSPDNNNTNGNINFLYNVVETNLDNCSLYINGTYITKNDNNSNFTGITIGNSNDAQAWYVECYDQAGNSNQSAPSNVYFDNLTPIISGVTNSSITSSSAIVSWNVNEVSNNTVYYGTNVSNLDLSQTGTSTSASPSISLSGLGSSTTYYFMVGSCDRWNLCTNDTTNHSFTTSTPFSSSSSRGGGSSSDDTQCEDGEDNDGDGLTDMNDPGCESKSDNNEFNVIEEETCKVEWTCGEWKECVGSKQTRICEDLNGCGVDYFKPSEEQGCEMPAETSSEGAFEPASPASSPGVGQATGLFNRIKGNWYYIAGAIAALGGLALIGWRRNLLSSKGRGGIRPPFAQQ